MDLGGIDLVKLTCLAFMRKQRACKYPRGTFHNIKRAVLIPNAPPPLSSFAHATELPLPAQGNAPYLYALACQPQNSLWNPSAHAPLLTGGAWATAGIADISENKSPSPIVRTMTNQIGDIFFLLSLEA
ncbi:hypothetical protein GDO86_009969 [Hymenochirus boettgeri]|uniref:Uncharacterized protein n=1 Tax=Hymenochirus boettgeri TaxID=247094 RepID=A0A8T2JMP5_9PIPI|nr:hypothetical protein GDO86_009969 [Hymenochirus boettgeri]